MTRSRMMRLIIPMLSAVLCSCERSGSCPEPAPQGRTQAFHSREPITIAGKVESIIGSGAFIVSADGWDVWADRIPVLANGTLELGGSPLEVGDELIITGAVREGTAAEVGLARGFRLDASMRHELSASPTLLAHSIRKVGEYARWNSTDVGTEAVGLLMLQTIETPASLVGSRVRLDSMVVQEVAGNALWVGRTRSRQVLVVPKDRAMLSGIAVGTRVDVDGLVQAMPTKKRAGTRFGLGPKQRQRLTRDPVYVEAVRITTSGAGRAPHLTD